MKREQAIFFACRNKLEISKTEIGEEVELFYRSDEEEWTARRD